MKLSDSVTAITGVGDEVAKKLHILGISNILDLLQYYPRRYNDFSTVEQIKEIVPGPVTLKVTIKQSTGRYVRRGMHITEAIASDKSGSVRLVWFNQPYRSASLKASTEYYISGEFKLQSQRLSILNPAVELVSDFPVNTARIVPIYKETKGLKSAQIRKFLRFCFKNLDNIDDTLPDWIVKNNKLISRSQAIEQIHFPKTQNDIAKAQLRLGFEEVFELSLAGLLNKRDFSSQKSVAIQFDESFARDFVAKLPFTLTDTQRKAVWEIYQDIKTEQPMNRLLEGDVGSGKTVVAAMAAAMAIKRGFQVAIMAPTEILARQLADTMFDIFAPLGMQNEICLLIGSLTGKQKDSSHANIKSGKARLIIGTHALIQEKVVVQNLGLVIIDEQHRFGVEQRRLLQSKAGHAVHVLSMTATPIPRSLALTLYGEMDISILETKPSGRKPVITQIVSPNSRKQMYEAIDSQFTDGRQAFIVTPLITDATQVTAESAESMFNTLSNKVFPRRKGDILHGKMKPDQKEAVMKKFATGQLDYLVSTTVVEVGVNIPNASVMVIENAERFGLAQAHQLRGRVGRNNNQGYCYLVLGDSNPPSRRIKALQIINDGFALAELDMEIRGPGAIYGMQQHGALDLRIAKLTDVKLIKAAKNAATEFIQSGENLLEYKQLQEKVNALRAVTSLN